jgi:dihydrofolate reductase
MRIIMAVSADGFLCKGPDDDMSWTGKVDKLLFKILTSVGRVCAAGAKTYDLMPKLKGRVLHRLSRGEGMTLESFQLVHPEGWLIGGPTVVEHALREGMVTEVHLCWILNAQLEDGVPFAAVFPLYLSERNMVTQVGSSVRHERYEVRNV